MKYLAGGEERRQFRAAGIAMFASWCALVLWRIAVYFMNIESELASDAAFTLPVQLVFLLLTPFLIYRFGLKMSTKEVLEFSNVRKCRVTVLLLSLPLGFCVYIATIGVSTVWQSVLMLLGYNHSYSSTVYPEKFNFFMFLASLILTAVLPAICEEFSVRGGLLTVIGRGRRRESAVIIMGVFFGLFHQNVTQVFYTALFGMLMAYIAYGQKSILPCMIVHFINNGTGVYLDYAEAYGWWGNNFYDWINLQLERNPLALLMLYFIVIAVGAVILYVMREITRPKEEKTPAHPPEPSAPKVNVNPFDDAGFDPFGRADTEPFGRAKLDPFAVSAIDPFDGKELPSSAPPFAPPSAHTAGETAFKPELRDKACYRGAIVLSVLTTLFSFFWGLF